MLDKIKVMFMNWKTASAGVVVLLCGGSSYLELLPDDWKTVAGGVCTIAVGLGLIASKDSDKTNSQHPSAEPTKVPG